MKSLRARLQIGTMLCVVLITAACGGATYWLVEANLRAQFDADLQARGQTLAGIVELDDEGYQFEWKGPKESLPAWFSVQRPDGTELAGSPAMGAARLPPFPDTDRFLFDLELNDGTAWRGAALRVVPPVEKGVGEKPAAVRVVVAEPTAGLDSTLSSLRLLVLAATGLSIAAGLAMMALVVPAALGPLQTVAARIGSVRPETPQLLSETDVPPELLPVVVQINALLARTEATLRREREFAAGAAHELRTPLAGIRAKLELALARERQPEEHRKLEQSALDVAAAMQAIVQNLLILARPESSDSPATREQVDLHGLLGECWANFAATADAKGASVSWDLRAQPLILADRYTLQSLLSNLLENAAEYVDATGRIEVSTTNQGASLVLRVSNSGCALSAAQAARVFEPFWRGDAARTGRAHAGLGLAICRRLATAMQGRVDAAIKDGRFTITLELPVHE